MLSHALILPETEAYDVHENRCDPGSLSLVIAWADDGGVDVETLPVQDGRPLVHVGYLGVWTACRTLT